MRYTYKTIGVCSSKITFNLDGDIVKGVEFTGGCNGNLKAIAALVEGMKISELEAKLKNNTCGGKRTSCADQLAIAVRQAYDGN